MNYSPNVSLLAMGMALALIAPMLFGDTETTGLKQKYSREQIQTCKVETKKLCRFGPLQIREERACVKDNLGGLSIECRNLIEDALDRRRPVSLPNAILQKKAQ